MTRHRSELEGLYASDIEFLINEIVMGLEAKRNKQIIRESIFDGLPVEDLAHKYGLSPTRVKTVIRRFRHSVAEYRETRGDGFIKRKPGGPKK